MFAAEAARLAGLLSQWTAEDLSPLLNIGSSTRTFREQSQPWLERDIFGPLTRRNVSAIHLDICEGEGIDIRADMLNDSDLARLKALGPKTILCCNILEHVTDPRRLAANCIDVVGPGGLIFVTVPYSYPYHRAPIDTLYRPKPDELARLFAPALMVHGEILDVGESYRTKVKARPFAAFSSLLRLPFPFLGLAKWKRSAKRLYWLFNNYLVTVAVFQVPVQPAVSNPPN